MMPNHSPYASYTTIQKPQTRRDFNDEILQPIKKCQLRSGLERRLAWQRQTHIDL